MDHVRHTGHAINPTYGSWTDAVVVGDLGPQVDSPINECWAPNAMFDGVYVAVL